MTKEEFNKTKFGANQQVYYQNKVFNIISVDFEEQLIGIDEFKGKVGDIDEPISWKRCENVELCPY